MGKGDAKTRARRNRDRLKAALVALKPVKRRERSGRASRADHPAEDVRLVALMARCRIYGIAPTEAALREVSAPEYWHPALRVIAQAGGRDAERLSKTFEDLDKAQDRFYKLVLNMSRFPAVAKLEYLPEPFEARTDEATDIRSHAERVDAAKRAYGYWLKRLKHLRHDETVLIDQGLQRYDGYLRDGKVTSSGLAFVAAVRALSSVTT